MLIAIVIGTTSAFAQTLEKIDDLYYNLYSSDKTATVAESNEYKTTFNDKECVIPATVSFNGDVYTVTAIDNNAFVEIGFTSVKVAGSVKSIGNSAFFQCENLKEVTLEEGITSLGESVFQNCFSLEQVSLPSTITQIPAHCFFNTWIEKISIPKGVTTIGYGAFQDCKNLSEITIPGSVTTIEYSAFQSCIFLEQIVIPEGVTSIGNTVFENCTNLTSVSLPESLTQLGGGAFNGCKSITEINIPSKLTTIGNNCFSSLSSLRNLVVPATVSNIEEAAFPGSIKYITFESADLYKDYMVEKNGMDNLFSVITNNGTEVPRNITVLVPEESVEGYQGVLNPDEFHVYAMETFVELPEGSALHLSEVAEYYKVGEEITLTATLTPEPLTIALNWTSSDDAIATVSESGVVSMKGPGKVTIKVTAKQDRDITNEVTFDVYAAPTDITVQKSDEPAIIVIGDEIELTATINPATTLQKVDWTVSDEKGTIETDPENPLAAVFKPISAGDVTVTATSVLDSEISGVIEMTVYAPTTKITVKASQERFDQGESIQLEAVINPDDAYPKVEWSSSNTDIATVDETGKVTGIGTGEVTITASALDGSKASGEISLEVVPYVAATGIAIETPSKSSILVNERVTLTATPNPDDATGVISWKSSDEDVAKVDAAGIVTGVDQGEVTITATITNKDQTTFSDMVTITVVPLVEEISLEGEGVKNGEITMITGRTLTVTATISPEKATQSLSWSSDNTEVATVSENGEISTLTPGTATITATATDGSEKSASIVVTVVPAGEKIELTGAEENEEILIGNTVTLKATVTPDDASQEVEWSSSNDEIASVDSEGVVTAIAEGEVTITATATDGSGISGSIKLIVTVPVDATTITIKTPDKTALETGQTLKLIAITDPEDATGKISWQSDNTEIATVDEQGNVKAVKEGTVEITAVITNSDGTEITSEPVTLTITAPKIVQATFISVSPKSIMVTVGEQFTINATVRPANATTDVVWNVDDTSLCRRIYSSNQTAAFKALAEGKTTITAALANGMYLSASVEVIISNTSGIDSVNADAESGEATIYDLSGRRLSRISKAGFYIVNGKKVFVR